MALNATVRARVDEELKYEVEEILKAIGLSTSQAITLFLKRIRYEKGIPFELKVPNATTIKAMEEADRNDGETVSFDKFLKDDKDDEVVESVEEVENDEDVGKVKDDKVVVNSGCASMGYDLPAAIGACAGNNFKDVICVTGDGSLQMNIQEFQTIIHNNLKIKLFVLNNDGYISIRNTQNNFFNGHKVGADKESGVSFPNIIKIAKAYGFKTFKIENQQNLEIKLKKILQQKAPFVCEVMLSPNEKMEPKLSSEIKEDGTIISKPLEDMYPFLDREEFKKNMIIKTVE